MHTWNISTQKLKTGGSGFQSLPLLHNEFEVSLGCTTPCLKNKQKKRKEKPRNRQGYWWACVGRGAGQEGRPGQVYMGLGSKSTRSILSMVPLLWVKHIQSCVYIYPKYTHTQKWIGTCVFSCNVQSQKENMKFILAPLEEDNCVLEVRREARPKVFSYLLSTKSGICYTIKCL